MINRRVMPETKPVRGINLPNPVYSYLTNGIPVALLPSGHEPICRLDLVFDAGSRYQDQLLTASLTAQMIPEGTSTKSGGEIAELFEFYGSFFNAVADRDQAEITLHAPGKHMAPLLEITREVLFQPAFNPDMLEIIKQNRIQSMLVDDQRVESASRKAFIAALFGREHPYGAVAEASDVNGVVPEHLIRFYSRYYRPERCRILVTGLNPEQYLPLIDQALGHDWPTTSNSESIDNESLSQPSTASSSRIFLPMKEAVQASIRMGKPLFSRKNPDFSGLSIVNTILGGYFGSRLMKNIREEKGLTYGISSHLATLRDHGFFMLGSTVEAGSADAALQECRKEMTRLASDLVPEVELELVRNYLTAQVQRSIDGPIQVAEQFRSLWMHEMDFSHLKEFIRLINNISPEEIRDLAAKYLNPTEMIEVIAGPTTPVE